MIKKKISGKIDVKAKSRNYYPIKDIISGNEIEYSDDIQDHRIVLFSANTSNGYLTDEPIRNLFFQEDVSDLKITIFNESFDIIKGNFTLEFKQNEEKNEVAVPIDFINTNFSIDDVMEMGKSVYLEEQNNNYFFNKISPVSVKYYRVEPDRKSTDYTLNEYGIKEVVDTKCCNLMTPKNSLPQDEEALYTEWGYQYASFVVSVSSLYFEEIFGKGVVPRKDDFVVFMVGGIFMTVNSVTKKYGGNRCVIGYNMELSHNNVNGSIQGTDNLEMFADNSEKFFREFGMKDGKDSTNEEFNLANYIHHDFNRKLLTNEVKVVDGVADWNYYSPIITDDSVDHPVVSYKNKITTNKNFAVSFYSKLLNEDGDDVVFTIGDEMEFGFASGIPYFVFYGETTTFGNLISTTNGSVDWNIYLININLQEGKIDFVVYNPENEIRKSLKLEIQQNVFQETNDLNISIKNSDIGKIRAWKNVLPIEYEKRILFSKIVEKPSSAYIIDDCSIILNSRTHARPDNMERSKDFDKNRGKIN